MIGFAHNNNREDVSKMGLDMYLNARTYVSRVDYSQKESKVNDVYVGLESMAPEDLTKYSEFGGISVSYPVGYWRKANAIHGWFVNELANGLDECQEISVSRESLVKLHNLCLTAVNVPKLAAKVLPPTEGFFFGGGEVDKCYMQDLTDTIKIIDHILSIIPEDDYKWEFIYQASW